MHQHAHAKVTQQLECTPPSTGPTGSGRGDVWQTYTNLRVTLQTTRWLLPFQEPPLSVAWLLPDNVPSVAETPPWPGCTPSKAPASLIPRPNVPTGTPPNRDPVDSEDEPYLPISAHRCAQPAGATDTPRQREGPPTVWPMHMQQVPERLLTLHLH